MHMELFRETGPPLLSFSASPKNIKKKKKGSEFEKGRFHKIVL